MKKLITSTATSSLNTKKREKEVFLSPSEKTLHFLRQFACAYPCQANSKKGVSILLN
jgi:hypothetical protein